MCLTRSWKILDITANNFVVAERSDGLLLQFFEANEVGDFIEKLESYRNCKCSQTTPCDKHKQIMENKENVSK